MNRTQDDRTDRLAAAAIRSARAADLPELRDFFAGLSLETRYLRFFAPTTPGAALLDVLCGGDGTADVVLATRDGAIIGHAMAADRSAPGGARMTDIGVVVADAWQGQGVGSALVRALTTRAQTRGVTSVTMDVLHGNHRALAMIARQWPAARTRRTRDYETICAQICAQVPQAGSTSRRHDPPARAGGGQLPRQRRAASEDRGADGPGEGHDQDGRATTPDREMRI